MRNIFTHWESVINFTRNDIVFENHNKEYGAYAIRKYYPERLRNAFLYATSGMVLLFAIPLVLQKLNPVKPKITIPSRIIECFFPPVKIEVPVTKTANPQEKQKPVETTNVAVTDNTDADNSTDPQDNSTSDATVTSNTDDTSINGSDNTGTTDTTIVTPDPVPYAQIMPEFIGGDAARENFLHDHLKYPRQAIEIGLSGRVYVTFEVDTKGKVTNVVLAHGIVGGELLEEEALRVVRLMPDWKPGRNNGQPVRVRLTIPVNFVLK